jgi:hypothetical protein
MANKPDFKIVQILSKRDPARFRGPFSSEEYNTFQDNVVMDLTDLGVAANTNAQNLKANLQWTQSENLFLKRRIESLEASRDYREHTFGKASVNIDKYIDFHDTSHFIFPTSLPSDKAAPFKGQFGEVSLPTVAVENKFYNFSLRTTEIILPDDLTTSVTSQFDKLDGQGLQDFEFGGKVTEGIVERAFNGLNEQAWVRTVEFPLESDVDQVEVQLTAVVPAGVSSSANLIELVPFPEGSVDVTEISTAANLGVTFTQIDGFSEVNNLTARRYHFPPRSVEQVRIKLRSRNWRELNGKKVFLYGLQELGLKLVDYRKEFIETDAFAENPTVMVKFQAPTSHVFDSLLRIDPQPNFFLEDENVDARHVRLRMSTTQDFSGTFWDSATDEPPQLGSFTGIAMGQVAEVYAIYTLKFVSSSGGLGSPYLVGTTSYLNGLGIVFTANPTNANA